MSGKKDLAQKYLSMIFKMANFNYKSEIIECEKWLIRDVNRSVLYKSQIREINEILNGIITLDSIGSIASRLDRLAFWYVQSAMSQVIACPVSFRCNWLKYIDYIRCSMRMRIVRIEHPLGNGSIGAYEIHRHFNLLLGNDLLKDAFWLGQRIYDSIKNRASNPIVYDLQEISEEELDRPITHDDDPRNLNRESISGYSESPLCGFVLRMWLILAERREPKDRLPLGSPQCGVYDALFDAWDAPGKLNSAILEACEFHVRRMKEDRSIPYDIAEFDMSPFRQIPFEILAYRNVRKRIGLETPWPSHPLLESPFVKNLPDELPPSDDPLLKEVLAAVRTVLPDV